MQDYKIQRERECFLSWFETLHQNCLGDISRACSTKQGNFILHSPACLAAYGPPSSSPHASRHSSTSASEGVQRGHTDGRQEVAHAARHVLVEVVEDADEVVSLAGRTLREQLRAPVPRAARAALQSGRGVRVERVGPRQCVEQAQESGEDWSEPLPPSSLGKPDPAARRPTGRPQDLSSRCCICCSSRCCLCCPQ